MVIIKSVPRFAGALLGAALLAGCSLFGGGDKPPVKDPGVSKMYQDARAELEAGNYEKAVKSYEALEARYPYGAVAQQAELEMAYAQYKGGESANAVSTCERFIKAHPNHVNVDYAFYVKGLANFKDDFGYLSLITTQDLSERDQKAARDAFDTFKELITRFPLSRYAEDSGKRMVYLQNNMAAHEAHVADYYFRRGAWIAAVDRASIVVKDFPRAPATEKALYLMVRSYQKLGLDDLANDSLAVFQKNFPNSTLLSDARAPSPWWEFWHGLF